MSDNKSNIDNKKTKGSHPKAIFLAKNLNFLLGLHKIDMKNLSAATNLPYATIAQIKKTGANPTISSLSPLAEFFRVDIDTLLFQDMTDKHYQSKKRAGELIHIPVMTLSEVKNYPCKTVLEKFIGAAGITNENVFGISIETDSLLPYFRPDSVVIVDPDAKPKNCDIVVCYLDDSTEPTFRQLLIDGSDYFFNPIHPSLGQAKQHEKFKIIGTVIKSLWGF